MSQTFQTIDLEPQPQKPMVAHLHDSSQQTSSAQQVCFNERHPQDLRIVLLTQKLQPSARNPINAEPQVSMRGGGIIGDAYVTTTSNPPDLGTTSLHFCPTTSLCICDRLTSSCLVIQLQRIHLLRSLQRMPRLLLLNIVHHSWLRSGRAAETGDVGDNGGSAANLGTTSQLRVSGVGPNLQGTRRNVID